MIEAVIESTETAVHDEFSRHVIDGLQLENKKLHPKYFYDKKGSEYFDEICHLEEYYPYTVELELLPTVAADLKRLLKGRYSLIEFGAGSLLKVKPLLDKVPGIKQFVPIDISSEHLFDACCELKDQYPELNVRPVSGDFTQPIDLPVSGQLRNLGFFPGSTIGNFTPTEAAHFLKNARVSLGESANMIVGVDTKKSPEILHRAYNDASGVTAKFNLNILARINQKFDDAIDVEKFEHYAYYNMVKGCVEMHLVSTEDQEVSLGDVGVHFAQGESIHTESSYKYSPSEFESLANKAGWEIQQLWLARNDMFSIFLLRGACC